MKKKLSFSQIFPEMKYVTVMHEHNLYYSFVFITQPENTANIHRFEALYLNKLIGSRRIENFYLEVKLLRDMFLAKVNSNKSLAVALVMNEKENT